MNLNDLSVPISGAVAVLVTPLVMRALSRAFPASSATALTFDSLRARYGRLEAWSQLSCLVGLLLGVAILVWLRPGNTPWLVGVIFGWMLLLPVLHVSLVTLPRGPEHWSAFWRYYELKYGISLRVVGPVYGALCVVGIISTAVLLWRQ